MAMIDGYMKIDNFKDGFELFLGLKNDSRA
jgi:pentatricopeptide repeat protein